MSGRASLNEHDPGPPYSLEPGEWQEMFDAVSDPWCWAARILDSPLVSKAMTGQGSDGLSDPEYLMIHKRSTRVLPGDLHPGVPFALALKAFLSRIGLLRWRVEDPLQILRVCATLGGDAVDPESLRMELREYARRRLEPQAAPG